MNNEIKRRHQIKANAIIEQLIAEELAVANKLFPYFASIHEGHSVLTEEVEELQEEVESMHQCLIFLWQYVRHQNNPAKQTYDPFALVDSIKNRATKTIEEAIQVAAMCDKFQALNKTPFVSARSSEDGPGAPK